MVNDKGMARRIGRPGNGGLTRLGFGLVAVVLLLLVSQSCGQAAPATDWTVPYLGRMTGPDGFAVLDLENWLREIETTYGKEKAGAKPIALPKGINLYQLQVNDGKACHIAFVVAVRDTANFYPGISQYFGPSLTAEQTKQLNELNGVIRNSLVMAQTTMVKNKVGTFQILDLKSLTRMGGTREVVYSISGRLILDMSGLTMPMYGKGYVLERNGKAVVVFIGTYDADGAFWDKTADQLLRSLERRVQLLDTEPPVTPAEVLNL